MSERRIAFVSREVYPFDSAGLGNYVGFAAAALAGHADVTVFTARRHEARYEELRAAGDPRLPAGVRFEFIDEPHGREVDHWYTPLQLWSSRALEALVRVYPDGGPDLVEFPDYLGEGCATTQAAQTLDPRLRRTTVCVRAYTTAEMCAVLDGFIGADRDTRLTCELERYALRRADHFLWPGGGVLHAYRSFYGATGIASPIEVAHVAPSEAGGQARAPADGPTAFLYVGRLERRKGVQNLIRAATMASGDAWSLTLIGADTATAPLGTSMRAQLELMIAGDPRIRLLERVPREELGRHYAEADVCVSPSLWECWPNTVLEAFDRDRPVLATPVGGHLGMIADGRCGWLLRNGRPETLAEAIETLSAAGGGAEELAAIRSGAPRRRFQELTDPEPVRERYLELAARELGRRPAPRPASRDPLVSVVIPYFRMEEFVAETLESVRAQTFASIETIIVNDGSLRDEDAALWEIAERFGARLVVQPNSGLGQARNLGVRLARGEYVLPVDPDNVLLPTFVERCIDVLERRPEVGYVTSWSQFIDEDSEPLEGGYQPLGNTVLNLRSENMAGDAMALIRRRLFERELRYSADLTSYEDWLFYSELRRAGIEGHVIPERLFHYRVRRASMLQGVGRQRRERLYGELEAHRREAEVEWMPSSV